MRTLSLDLRERILASYDPEEGTREEITDRYRVSPGNANATSLYQAIALALERVTRQEAGNWFASCGYSFV